MGSLAPRTRTEGVAPGVFPTPAGKGVVCDWDDLLRALDDELEKYT